MAANTASRKSSKTTQQQKKTTTIEERSAATLKRLEEKDPGLKQVLKKAYGYAVFPSVGKASLVVGGSHGHGAVYERGKFIGHATISQFTAGVQIGGDTFTEVLVFENREALERLKHGKMAFAANASAVLVKAGAAKAKGFSNGVAAYSYASGGMLVEAAIGGQKFSFKPAGEEQGQGKSAAQKGKAAGASGEQDQGDSDEGQDEESSGLLGRAMGGVRSALGSAADGVKSAASRATDTAKAHPIATTVVATAAVTGAALLIVRAVRGSGGPSSSQDQGSDEEAGYDDGSSEEGDDQQQPQDQAPEGGEGEEEQDQGDGGDEEEEGEQGDTLNRLRDRRRQSRA